MERWQLVNGLLDPDSEPRLDVIREALALPEELALTVLLESLTVEDDYVRAACAWGLGKLQDARALPGLCAALGDDDGGVRELAAWALEEIDDERSVSAFALLASSADPLNRALAASAFGHFAVCLDQLYRFLDDPEPLVRKAAVGALADLDDPIRRAVRGRMRQLLADPDEGVRVGAAEVLGQEEGEAAVTALIPLLADPEPWVRGCVARILATVGDDEARRAVGRLGTDPDPRVRAVAAQALAGELDD